MIGSGTGDLNGKGGGRIVIVAETFDWYGRIDANGIPLANNTQTDIISKYLTLLLHFKRSKIFDYILKTFCL
jgi:hypothetical protein